MFNSEKAFRTTTTYNGDFTVMPVTVTVLAYAGEFEDGEPKWKVRLPESGKSHFVPECDLSPAPNTPELMSEKFAKLTDGFESPLVMGAAVEAIMIQAENVAENESHVLEAMKSSMVHGPAWIAAVKRAAEIVNPK